MSDEEIPLLVEPEWLETRLDASDLRILDCSWYLPDAGRDAAAEYTQAHIPGAQYVDLAVDLADPDAPVRNTLAGPDALARAFARIGVGSDHRVVVYDHLGGYSAGRVWWALRTLGHTRVGLLNGGLPRWQAEGRPTRSGSEKSTRAEFRPVPTPHWLARKSDVLSAVRTGGAQIVDARSPARFRGEGLEPARHKGHIPGSRNVPYSQNLVGDPPSLKDPEALRKVYAEAKVSFDSPVITTCGSGVTAALDAFVLVWLGHPAVAVYDGSWAEWGNADDVPTETGP